MNYAGTFGTEFSNDAPVSLTDHHLRMDSAGAPVPPSPADHDTILIPDSQLLFAGDFNRLGNNLVLSKDGHEFLVPDYFRGEKRAFLASPDGANLSGDVVQALTGHVQYVQAGGAQSAPKDIGQVSKLVGSATVIRNGVLIELHNSDRVYKGDVVQAGANSSCTIVFVDGSVFGLSASARMVLNEMVYDQAGTTNSALISLVRGTISFVAGETAKHGDMKVETPVATMGIRGTAVLVEIGFEIPSDGKGPPVNFQVLVEPDGTTGSYIIYSKSDPSMVIGTIDKAGQVYSVSGNGTFSNLPSPDMSQIAASIIQQVFTQRFQGYVPDKLVPPPQGGGGAGSTPATPPDPSIPKFPTAPGDGSVIIPITIQIQDGSGGTKTVTIPVGAGIANTAPAVSVHDVVTDAQNFTFNIADRVTIIDPDANNLFHDIPTPYVPGSATLISAEGPPSLPNTIHFNQLVTIDPQTGTVSYAPGAFAFLGQGQQVIITIEFDSKSGPDTVHETLHFIINGLNDTPTLAHVDAGTLTDTSAMNTFANLVGHLTGTDADYGETVSLTYAALDAHHHVVNDGVTGQYGTLTVNPDGSYIYVPNAAAINALQAGQYTDTFTVQTTDAHGATRTATLTVNVDGANDAPVIELGDLHVARVGGILKISGLSVSDADAGDNEHFMISSDTDHGWVFPPEKSGLLETINATLGHDLWYIPNNFAKSGEVTLTVTDGHQASDSVNFIFRQLDFVQVTLTGTDEKDVLVGGWGRDNFVFAPDSNQDIVVNFKPGEDKIVLNGLNESFTPSSFATWLNKHASSVSGGTLIDLDLADAGHDTILLQNVQKANLHAGDFIIHPGYA